ncbi:MAG: DUF1553 domain-containing protein [Zavarzinella sp.]
MKFLSVFVAGLLLVSCLHAADKLEYNQHIRPILADSCFACHGPDSAARKAGLRLDLAEFATKGGDSGTAAIVPGKPMESELYLRMISTDRTEMMPPPSSHKVLKLEQKEIIKRWILEGAEYQLHWSFIPPVRPALPKVNDPTWIRNPIDYFVLSQLEKRGMKPAPEADRSTIVRRLSLDIRGLPPSREEVEAVLQDQSPDWYEKLIDRFLRSPAWGEHRGRYWLDAARYADTHGIHFDNFREVWAYRDWVIDAFNQNMPFNQFSIEQLAGDLLPNATLEQKIASGFNRCNITTNEGGLIDEEYLVLYTRDRTETTSTVWLGLTAGCAVCHDHKFDPISQSDFYSLAAFFNNTTQGARDGNIPNTPPVIEVPLREDRAKWQALLKQEETAKARLEGLFQNNQKPMEEWLKQKKAGGVYGMIPSKDLQFHALLADNAADRITVVSNGQLRQITAGGPLRWAPGQVADHSLNYSAGLRLEIDDAGQFDRDQPFSVSMWMLMPKRRMSGALVSRMEAGPGFRGWDILMSGGKLNVHLINNWPGNAIKVILDEELDQNKWYHVGFSYDGSGKASGIRIFVNGEFNDKVKILNDNLTETINTDVPLRIGGRSADSEAIDIRLQDLRVYSKAIGLRDVAELNQLTRTAYLASLPANRLTGNLQREFLTWWMQKYVPDYAKASQEVATVLAEKAPILARGTKAFVMNEKTTPPEAFILHRGEYNERRQKVSANVPKVLPPMKKELPTNRLGFANWLFEPNHPLTARVTVNRFWQELFGRGIVSTPGDFGITGTLPTNPELLDWLALEFRDKGWNIKEFYKLIFMSNTYRQSAQATPEKLEKDPDNRYLSRGPRFRMDAEMIRDYALSSSDLLVKTIGGPSVRPYQPTGVWEAVAMPGSNTRNYKQDNGPNLYRRSMYTFWKRAAPPASMDIMNAPNRETCAVSRERTNTPLQALVTLNDPQLVEAARAMATKVLAQINGDEQRLSDIAYRLLGRPFTTQELPIVRNSLTNLKAAYAKQPEEAKKLLSVGEFPLPANVNVNELASWTLLINQLMNLDEVLNK